MSESIGRTSIGNDAELMGRVRAGDRASFATLMDRWELPLKSFAARIVLNATDAEDIAQETFVAVWQHRTRFRPGAEFKPWVFTIALNLARKRLRWWRRRPSVSLEAWTETEPSESADGHESAAGAEQLARTEIAVAVRDAVAALPTELREAIVLFEYEELSHAEIAAIVGATPKAVETRIYRAKEKLRAALKAWVS